MRSLSLSTGALLAVSAMAGPAFAQPAPAQPAPAVPAEPTIENLQASAKGYAGTDWMGTFQRLCVPTLPAAERIIPATNPADFPTTALPTPEGGTPPQANWYSPPAQIGDNLYFLGTRNHNTYVLVASSGEIILIDGNFEYATEAEIHDGLAALGLDINNVRYSIYAHAHGDHDGGAHLTEAAAPNATIVYGEGDWPGVMARTTPHATRNGPENDATDGRVISVGDVSVEIVTMPGHTPGTISMLFEFMDRGEPIRVAYVGGTAISFTNSDPAYYDLYIDSARKFADAAAEFGATALMSNHTEFDNAFYRAHAAQALRDGGVDNKDTPNPYTVGQRRVINYMAVVDLCAQAAKLRATGAL